MTKTRKAPMSIPEHWEDRIAKAGDHDKVVKAMTAFRSSKKNRRDQDILYTALTNLGCTAEEADEIVGLELES
jgi:hypothetical protein